MSTRSIVRSRKGQPIQFSYDLVLWRKRGGPVLLAAAVSQLKALLASQAPPGRPSRDPRASMRNFFV